LSLHEWRREMVDKSRDWLQRRYPVGAA
jgi:hypothetical protein